MKMSGWERDRKRSFWKHHCREYWAASLCCSETRWLHRKAWRDPIYISPVYRSRFPRKREKVRENKPFIKMNQTVSKLRKWKRKQRPWTHPARDPHPSKWKRRFFCKARFLSGFLPTDTQPPVALRPEKLTILQSSSNTNRKLKTTTLIRRTGHQHM